jgi:hypothetical protein
MRGIISGPVMLFYCAGPVSVGSVAAEAKHRLLAEARFGGSDSESRRRGIEIVDGGAKGRATFRTVQTTRVRERSSPIGSSPTL